MMASNAAPPQSQPQPPLTLPTHHRVSLAPYLPPHPPSSPLSSQTAQDPSATPPSTPQPPLPPLTLTYATSLDGHIALAPGLPAALSGRETTAMTHYLRSQHDAILIGANAAIVDNPSLNCRHVPLEGQPAHHPIPIILDPSARWEAPYESKVLRLARDGMGQGPLWVMQRNGGGDAVRRILEAGGDSVVLGPGLRVADGGVEWGVLLESLAARGIRSVMVEGGAKVIMDLLKEGNQRFVSSVIVTVAPVWLGEGGVTVRPPKREVGMEAGRLRGVKWLPMGEDVVMAGKFGDGSR